MAALPAGTVTLLFTDIEGSTRLLHALRDRYPDVLAAHRDLLRTAFRGHGGAEVDTQGDAFFVVFARAPEAVAAAIEAQRSVAQHPWPQDGTVRVRMGLHTGEPTRTAEGYAGLDIHRGARIAAAGHGGQVVLSEATAALVQAELPDGVSLKDLGSHRLKDLPLPEYLFQLVIPGLSSGFPLLKSLDPRTNNLPAMLPELVGREEELAEAERLLLETRLLSLTGSAGIGKTRLAVALGEQVLPHFPDGVWFVDLAGATDLASVPVAVVQVLGVREAGGQPLTETLQAYLRPRQVLLILDHFEHLLDAAPLLGMLLEAAPGLRLLVTSRIALRLPGEREYTVAPLSLPWLFRSGAIYSQRLLEDWLARRGGHER